MNDFENRQKFIDELINFLGNEEEAPLPFKILKARNDLFNTSSELMTNKGFITEGMFQNEKECVLKFFQDGAKLFEDVIKKIEE